MTSAEATIYRKALRDVLRIATDKRRAMSDWTRDDLTGIVEKALSTGLTEARKKGQ